jgi:tetratricopeptide (TPR) repeat protein
MLSKRGDVDGARAAYQVAIDSGHAEFAPAVWFNLGNLLVEEGDDEGARAAYQEAIDSGNPRQAGRAAVNLGNLLKRRGEEADAEQAYRLAADLGNAKGSLNLGALYAGQGRLDEARAAFQAAADSDDPEARQMADRRLAVLAERSGGPDSRLPDPGQPVQGVAGLGHDRLDQLRARRQVAD